MNTAAKRYKHARTCSKKSDPTQDTHFFSTQPSCIQAYRVSPQKSPISLLTTALFKGRARV